MSLEDSSPPSPGWFNSILMETYQDGAHLAPLLSPANCYNALDIENDSMDLMDVQLEDEVNHIALLINNGKGDY